MTRIFVYSRYNAESGLINKKYSHIGTYPVHLSTVRVLTSKWRAYWILTNERPSRLARVLARCTIIGRGFFRVEPQTTVLYLSKGGIIVPLDSQEGLTSYSQVI